MDIQSPERSQQSETSFTVRPRRTRGLRSSVQRRPNAARWLSLLIVIFITLTGAFVFAHPMFYVSTIEIGGIRYLPAEEVFARAGVSGFHILWVQPEQVEQSIAGSTSVDSVNAAVQWPARVIVVVNEREPALVWEEDGARYWVDVNGNMMVRRGEVANLVQVINLADSIPFICPGPTCEQEGDNIVQIDPALVSGAQQLKTLRDTITVLYYSEPEGLGFDDERGWRAYFGTGVNMDVKLVVYERLVAELLAQDERITYIDVSNPVAPFYGTR